MKQMPLDEAGAMIANRYRVEQTLGRGGMAVVYRVRDERLGRQLALKRCVARDPRKLRRYETLLEREYHTLAQLAHPHIIEVHDYGVDKRGPYYTMELLDGADLEKVDRLPWQQACAVLRDVASSLAILHSRGLLHRDVSMRNVHYSTNGHAKLFDFGAMTTMGVARETVGTPPFVAPEALQLQALDARSDLFSLGALAYRLLTGRHAFAARRFSELRDLWRSKPQPPASLVPEVPLELSALVMRLLTLDRAGRPQSAAEVIERLRTVALLELEDAQEISRAYLTTPTLVGREAALVQVRKRMLSLVRGDGGVLLVQGVAGSGRSRMLDACALEGKLLGAAVVRADVRDASNGEWGTVRALGAQLIELFPKQAFEAARLSRDLLGHVLDELRNDELQTATTYTPERSLLIRELREWILSLSKAQRLLIVVDDADRIDAASLALLSSIAHKADRHAVLLALSVERRPEQAATASLRLLRELAHTVETEHLQPAESEALIRSVFGDVPNLSLCAARIHGLSHGNPGAAMELAEHLVATGRARYAAGSWVLPPALDESDLPNSLAASLLARLAGLDRDARELADALALADGDAFRVTAYRSLTEHRDVKRVFRALDQLVAARILIADAERYTFAQRGFLSVLQDAMSAERRTQIHVRIANLSTAQAGGLLRRAHHLLAAGLDADGIELLCRIDLASEMPPVALLETAIARAERLGLPAATLHRLRMAVVINAPFEMGYDSFRRVAPIVLEQLERDSGLARYRELSELPDAERLSEAFAQTQRAYLAAPEHERVHSVVEAIRELARLSGAIAAMATPCFDLELLERLPALTPLFPLSPTLPVTAQVIEGSKAWVCGRLSAAKAHYEAVLARISEPDRAGLDDAHYERTYLGLTYTLGTLEAMGGVQSAVERAQVLEGHRGLRVNAWRIRALHYLALGDALESRKCSRRAELLQAQEGLKERYNGSTLGMELTLYLRLEDLLGVKSLLDGLTALAAQHEGWRAIEMLGRSGYRELQGDAHGALELIEAALELGPPFRLPLFPSIAASHLRLLAAVGRRDEALARVDDYIAICAKHELRGADLYRSAALIWAGAGRQADALRMLVAVTARLEAIHISGLALGVFYESAAQIAIDMNDRASFDKFAERCAEEYQKSNNPAVGAKLASLLDRARERGMQPSEAALSAQSSIRPAAAESEFETVQSRIAECVDSADRARCALTLLLQATVSSVGYLYGTGEGQRLRLLAALPDAPTDSTIERWLERYAQAWLEPNSELSDVTVSASDSAAVTTKTGGSEPNNARHLDQDGRWLEAAPLFHEDGRERCLAALLVLQTAPYERVILPRELTATIARELLERGDTNGWR
jgi:tRNA A-37 threonylcarbamoyl transferase component Bud32